MSLGEGKLNLSTLPLVPLPGESITIDIDNIELVKLEKKYIYILLKKSLHTNTDCIKITFNTEENAQREYIKITQSQGRLLLSVAS